MTLNIVSSVALIFVWVFDVGNLCIPGQFLDIIVNQDPSDSKFNRLWSETTLNYHMMVERYPNLKEEVGGSIPWL